MMRGIHTLRRDQTTQVISCNPWSTRLCCYPSLIRKMKTYLEQEGKCGNQPHANIFLPDKNSSPRKTPASKKAEKKKRAKAPVKRRFKVRAIAWPKLANPTLPANLTFPTGPTPTVVNTMATSTQMLVTRQKLLPSNPYLWLYTVWLKANSREFPIQQASPRRPLLPQW